MPRPADWFVQLLRLNHPLLSVRWSNTLAKWVIAQRAYINPTELYFLRKRKARLEHWINNPKPDEPASVGAKNVRTWQSVSEELESALQGERILFFPDRLDNQAYEAICRGEHAKYGGYARFVDEMAIKEGQVEREAERIAENKREAVHSEAYDIADFLTRRRSGEVGRGRSVPYLLHGNENAKLEVPV